MILIRRCLIVLTFFSLTITSILGQVWEQAESFPGTARDDGSTFTIGPDIYLGLGRDEGFNCTRDFFIYNSTSLTWTSGIPMPLGEERQYAVGASWNGKGIIFGGYKCDGSYLSDLWLYDPLISGWSEMTSLPSSGRAGSEHFIIADTLYIVGGKNDTGILTEVWAYNLITDEWTQKTNYPDNGVWRGLSFEWNQTGYAGMGVNSLSSLNTAMYSFDPVNQQWNPLADFGLSPRSYPGVAQTGNLIFIFGGVNPSSEILNSLDRLDLNDLTLHSLPPFPSDPRKGSMCFLINDSFYTSTGISSTQRINETWKISGVLGLEEYSPDQFKIYPNPAKDCITIESNEAELDAFSIQTTDGKIIRSVKPLNAKAVSIDITDIPNGVYIIRSENLSQLMIISN